MHSAASTRRAWHTSGQKGFYLAMPWEGATGAPKKELTLRAGPHEWPHETR